jgi:hypothetical protein
MYLRFAVPDPRSHALAPHGVFRATYALIRSEHQFEHHEPQIDALLKWFSANLPIPRTPRIGEHTIFWLKDRETAVARRMWDLVTLLRLCDRDVQMVKATFPGRIAYEDEHQIAADPQRCTFRELSCQQVVVLRSLRLYC